MIDAALLDQLARPCGVTIGPRPLQLEDVFQYVVSAGWAPRTPAYDDDELDQCEVSIARGTCLEPLVIAGDVLYTDPRVPPRAGDLVSFRLSARGASAQNSGLPPGQPTWRKGDPWLKLYVPYRGVADMLLENTGHAATTTLLGGESPDARVALAPLRNIRRNGRLLFRDCYMSEIGLNAATGLTSVTQSFSGGGSAFGTGVTLVGSGVSFTPAYSCTIELTVSCDIAADGGPDSAVYFVGALQGNFGLGTTQTMWQGNSNTRGMATGTVQIAVTAGTTYTAGLFCNNGPGAANIKCWGYTLNVDIIKR